MRFKGLRRWWPRQPRLNLNLSAARAEYQHAQEDLQRAQSNSQSKLVELNAQRQTEGRPAASSGQPQTNQIVSVRATRTGTLRVVNARVGQRITRGQPLATLSVE
ncbi:MAG: hypothetical protein WKF84_07090 [Pyrinomonadaceae bacterium]